jgi:HK97 family phage major capsid protein
MEKMKMTKKKTKTATKTKTIKAKPLYRNALIERAHIDEESRTVELAFSSEEPVNRWFGDEILDHEKASIRLNRLSDGGAVLVDHNPSDHVGVVESISIGNDRRGRAKVRFGKSARAEEIFQDVLDGIRISVSVGYRIYKSVIEERSEDGDAISYRVTDWEPHEISMVSIPADASVGVGRNENEQTENDFIIEKNEVRTMPEAIEKTEPVKIDTNKIAEDARKKEQERVRGLLAVGETYNAQDLAREHINSGATEGDLNKAILERMGKTDPIEAKAPDIGLTEKEVRQFSFTRAIHALANPNDRRAQEAAAFEFECSSAAQAKTQRDARGVLVPVDVLKRDLSVGVAADGGDTVATDLLAGSFIDLLRNQSLMMQLATVFTDLNGNIAIPRQTGGATAYWVGENGAPTESQQAFDQISLSPNTVGAFTEYSRKLLLQSSIDVEQFVRGDLARTLALEIDRVCIYGSGASNQPLGILNVTGIGDVAGGANGAIPGWGNVVDLETEVAIDNADIGSLRYLTNAKVRGTLKQTEKATGTAQFIWSESGNMINGYESLVTNQVPSNLVKGASGAVCSALIFGNFADLIIGMWGGLDLQVNPYSLDTTGAVRVTSFQDVDTVVRHPESFAAMQDALTS